MPPGILLRRKTKRCGGRFPISNSRTTQGILSTRRESSQEVQREVGVDNTERGAKPTLLTPTPRPSLRLGPARGVTDSPLASLLFRQTPDSLQQNGGYTIHHSHYRGSDTATSTRCPSHTSRLHDRREPPTLLQWHRL